MKKMKAEILAHLCYTDLVYGRINKKLGIDFSKSEIEKFISESISETDESDFVKKWKNVYIANQSKNTRLTINMYTYRIITADRLDAIKK